MSFVDKLSKRKNKKMVLAEGTTPDDLRNYVKDRIEEKADINPRKEGRPDNAVYAAPFGLAPLGDSGFRINTITGKIEDEAGVSRDIAMILWDEIYCHGRKTIDELVNRYKAYDKHLLQIVINLMIQEYYLKEYKEKDGVRTLELLTEQQRLKKLKPRLKSKSQKRELDVNTK